MRCLVIFVVDGVHETTSCPCVVTFVVDEDLGTVAQITVAPEAARMVTWTVTSGDGPASLHQRDETDQIALLITVEIKMGVGII